MLLGIEALGGLTLGDAPFSPFIPPIFPRTAADLIVCDATLSGFGLTDVTKQAFQFSNVAIIDPDRVFQHGALFVFMAGIPMENAINPVCKLLFTTPTGGDFEAQTPEVYIGEHDLSTYLGGFAGNFYIIYTFPPFVLVRGQWSAQLSYQQTPQRIPILSDIGTFNV